MNVKHWLVVHDLHVYNQGVRQFTVSWVHGQWWDSMSDLKPSMLTFHFSDLILFFSTKNRSWYYIIMLLLCIGKVKSKVNLTLSILRKLFNQI